jgi:hypothetical protein
MRGSLGVGLIVVNHKPRLGLSLAICTKVNLFIRTAVLDCCLNCSLAFLGLIMWRRAMCDTHITFGWIVFFVFSRVSIYKLRARAAATLAGVLFLAVKSLPLSSALSFASKPANLGHGRMVCLAHLHNIPGECKVLILPLILVRSYDCRPLRPLQDVLSRSDGALLTTIHARQSCATLSLTNLSTKDLQNRCRVSHMPEEAFDIKHGILLSGSQNLVHEKIGTKGRRRIEFVFLANRIVIEDFFFIITMD